MRLERGDDVILFPARWGELFVEFRVATAAMVDNDVAACRTEVAAGFQVFGADDPSFWPLLCFTSFSLLSSLLEETKTCTTVCG